MAVCKTTVGGDLLRRRCSLWLRFTVLLFGFCLIALIEGVILARYDILLFVVVVGITLFVIAQIAPKLLGRNS